MFKYLAKEHLLRCSILWKCSKPHLEFSTQRAKGLHHVLPDRAGFIPVSVAVKVRKTAWLAELHCKVILVLVTCFLLFGSSRMLRINQYSF